MLNLFLAPLFLHVVLIFILAITGLRGRIAAINAGLRLEDVALDVSKYPVPVRQIGNNFNNQFEVPVLWYAASLLLWLLAKVDLVAVILTWAFIFARYVHSYIHTGSNNVRHRTMAYLSSLLCVVAMWAWLALRLYVIG